MKTVIEIIGVNGDNITIAGEGAGQEGVLLDKDVKGLIDPEVDTYTKIIGKRHGTKFLGYRIKERTLSFTVIIYNGDKQGASWRERDNRWRELWDFQEYAQLRVTTESDQRWLNVRLESIEVDTTFDPHTNTATSVSMVIVADDPFYHASPHISEVVVASDSIITVHNANPGDIPVYPEWVLEAPGRWTIPDYNLEVQSTHRRVTLPDLDINEHLVVNTDPASRQLATPVYSPVWQRMNGVRFRHPIPPKTGEVRFSVSRQAPQIPGKEVDFPSSGSCRLIIPRRYTRPWGV